MCGEKASAPGAATPSEGSPPHVRGKGFCYFVRHSLYGITPAYAGKSNGIIGALNMIRDHPRVCGEKCSVSVFSCYEIGSPPRMRGKVE